MVQEGKLTMTKIKKCIGKKSSKINHYRTKMAISMVIRFRRPYRQRFGGFVNCRNARFLPFNNFLL